MEFGMTDLEDELQSAEGQAKRAEVLERLGALRAKVANNARGGLSVSEFEKADALVKAIDCACDIIQRYPVKSQNA